MTPPRTHKDPGRGQLHREERQMGRTKRDQLKRELAQALHHLETASNDIGTVWQQFDGVHDDYAQLLVAIGQMIKVVQKHILEFWVLAWGKLPPDIESYRR